MLKFRISLIVETELLMFSQNILTNFNNDEQKIKTTNN